MALTEDFSPRKPIDAKQITGTSSVSCAYNSLRDGAMPAVVGSDDSAIRESQFIYAASRGEHCSPAVSRIPAHTFSR